MRILNWFRGLFRSNSAPVTPIPVVVPSIGVPLPYAINTEATPTLPAGVPEIRLGTISCENDDQKQMIIDSNVMLNKVLPSPEYKEEFMAFPFEQTNGMTNQQLWDLFVANSPMTLNIDLHDMGFKYDHIYHTVGLDNSDDPDTVYLNSYAVGSAFTAADCTLHEGWHRLKLSHLHPTDYNSVPYGNNTIFESVAAKLGLK